MPKSVEIVSCSCADPYVALLLSDASFWLLTVNEADFTLVSERPSVIIEDSKNGGWSLVALLI